ncbi:Fe3+-hydroxamate ABC transporter,periplasmic protein [Actinobacillus ureae]|uniref:Fe/B12 periplasmic-binding domain-containing protein n=1 Tax=Actinobacillus ureae ATCC 25976 TaxID=887324 RepID=E8KKG7_9PAST|nr:ABC transporter substrate-binding protein [Actinobacillus ureae]EFX90628.1 hypothetical protein HMPREF0027_2334 [Actinobacillus ureae ATCC 25976]SUT87638.1 Fe3+-hydroxamate ABC transporter,periplasmic protein [Actinobacillus ureae]SUU49208.1 Fe3+-hydroxamate ABC transporter,periplasmic protein [Actinobacillus ureae]
MLRAIKLTAAALATLFTLSGLANAKPTEITDILERKVTVELPAKRVVLAFNYHSFTFGKSMWGAMIDLVGAENIAKNAVEFYSPINSELVVAAKPDVLIISGRETELKKNPEAMVAGFNIDKQEEQKRLAGFAKRPGWSELPAIKNQRLYGVYHANSRTLSDSASIQFVAKAIYPELFKDLDSTKTYQEFYRKNLPIVPQGTFYLYPESK